jgi:hypothetical protein
MNFPKLAQDKREEIPPDSLGIVPGLPFILGTQSHKRCRNQGETREFGRFHLLVPGLVTYPSDESHHVSLETMRDAHIEPEQPRS